MEHLSLGAPYWNSSVRGGFYGITQDTRREEMVTAAFESICFQVLDIIKILEDYKISSEELRVDGGMIANNVFCTKNIVCDHSPINPKFF